MLSDYWPLMKLRVTTPRLELRLPAGDELAELAAVAAAGVHPPGRRVFLDPWPEKEPPTARGRAFLQRQWQQWGDWTPQKWVLDLAVFVDGQPVGAQGLFAREFPVRREVATGSWLGLAYQGKGIGTEMRAAAVHLAFAGLGAEYVTSASFLDNSAPLAVSRKLGYQPDGISRDARDGEVMVSQRLRLSRADWDRRDDRPAVTITGLDACLDLFRDPAQ